MKDNLEERETSLKNNTRTIIIVYYSKNDE